MQYFVEIIDAISPLVTLGFGIYAATTDTKPKDGKFSSQGRIALWGLIISGLITLIVKLGGLYGKIENDRKLATAALKSAQDRDSTIHAQTVFQDSVAKSLKNSLADLSNIKNASKTTLNSLSDVAVDQRTTLLNTRRSLNPLLPVEIALSYELNIDSILSQHSHKAAIYFYLNKLRSHEKEHLLELRSHAGHFAGSIDTTNISFDPMVIPDTTLLEDRRFSDGAAYFAALLPTMFTIELRTSNANKSPTHNESYRIVGFEIFAKESVDSVTHQRNFELSSDFDSKKKSLHVEIWPIKPNPHVDGFVSLYDLENSFISLSNPRSADNRIARLENAECLKLNYITINTGYQLSKKIQFKFSEKDRSKNNSELYSRLIKPEDLR